MRIRGDREGHREGMRAFTFPASAPTRALSLRWRRSREGRNLGGSGSCVAGLVPNCFARARWRDPSWFQLWDEEWVFVLLYLTLMSEDAPQRWHDLRLVFDALKSVVRSGIA